MADEQADEPETKSLADLLSADDIEAILATDDRATVDVYVPEWKKTVKLRQWTGAEGVALADVPKKELAFHIMSLSIVDAKGNRLFKDPAVLKGRSAAVASLIQEEALKLNGLSARMAAALKNA